MLIRFYGELTLNSCRAAGSVILIIRDMQFGLLLFGVNCARPEASENTVSVQRPQPQTNNPWKKEKK